MIKNDHIRDLCVRAATAEDDEFDAIIKELRVALREHVQDAENRSMAILLQMPRSKLKSGT